MLLETLYALGKTMSPPRLSLIRTIIVRASERMRAQRVVVVSVKYPPVGIILSACATKFNKNGVSVRGICCGRWLLNLLLESAMAVANGRVRCEWRR